jgi:hypothetical protein
MMAVDADSGVVAIAARAATIVIQLVRARNGEEVLPAALPTRYAKPEIQRLASTEGNFGARVNERRITWGV